MPGRDRRDFGGIRREQIAAPHDMQVRPQHDEIEAADLARHKSPCWMRPAGRLFFLLAQAGEGVAHGAMDDGY